MAIDNSEKIKLLEQRLASGVSQESGDGQSVTFDSAEDVRKEIERLKREDTTGNYTTGRRVKKINLGGF